MEKFTGVVIIRIDGKSIRSKEKAELDPGGVERTPVYADGQIVGYSEKPIASKVNATIAHGSSTDILSLGNVTNGSLVFETDTGLRYLISGAFATQRAKLTGGEGDCSVEYMGKPATAA